ncbi:hypothetical protein EMIT0373P_60293 [Pseudomonas chlororaphis]
MCKRPGELASHPELLRAGIPGARIRRFSRENLSRVRLTIKWVQGT